MMVATYQPRSEKTMVLVDDIMTRGAMTLKADATVEDACERLLALRIGGAPVVDGSRVVGLVSKTDLLQKDKTAKVVDIMTPYAQFVRPSEPAEVAIALMLKSRIHRLVVLDVEGNVVGMITTMDIMRAVQRGIHLHVPPEWPHSDPAASFIDEGGF
jgi:CBS domain-containing protein